MAGRVGSRINDNFYFVVDEVGESSDCESEFTLDNDFKPRDALSGGNNMTKVYDAQGKKITVCENENKTPEVESFISLYGDENTFEGSCASDKSNGRKCHNESSDLMNEKTYAKMKSSSEESSAALDMDVDSPSDFNEPVMEPLIKIIFRDENVEKRFKSSFFKFISQKFEDYTILTNRESSLEIEVYDTDHKKLREYDLLDFNLDTTPGDSHLEIPCYGKSHDLVLSDKSSEEKQNICKIFVSNVSCFNCLGNHNLRDCPKAKDFREINKNRLRFLSQKEKILKTSRYHLDENQKFSHIIPGVISRRLRNALNLKRDQQPGFIYRMRILGYPPAWLEEAKVCHSGVAMYDGTGVPVLEEDEEEGEILPEGAKDKFDITKIIEFPGFNVPLPSSFRDESKLYHCPALSEEQSKKNLIKFLEPKTVQAYVKKSLSSPKCDEKSMLQNELKRTASPTIEEMEEKKRQLLMALNSEDGSFEGKASPPCEATPREAPPREAPPREAPPREAPPCEAPLREAPPREAPPFEAPPRESTPREAPFMCQTPTAGESPHGRRVGTVKNLEFGTPILKSVSPFSKLPAREQFSCNVSDVINFENLPNATGKYEAMKEVISKIRISVTKRQKE